MRGDAKLRQIAIEEQIAVQWHAAQMRVMAGAGKLDPLEDWLKRVRPRPKRTVSDMILALQDLAARGANITIRQVEG
jgi:hypothetical protein